MHSFLFVFFQCWPQKLFGASKQKRMLPDSDLLNLNTCRRPNVRLSLYAYLWMCGGCVYMWFQFMCFFSTVHKWNHNYGLNVCVCVTLQKYRKNLIRKNPNRGEWHRKVLSANFLFRWTLRLDKWMLKLKSTGIWIFLPFHLWNSIRIHFNFPFFVLNIVFHFFFQLRFQWKKK